MKAAKNYPLASALAACISMLLLTRHALAGPPPGLTTEQYQQWLKDNYVPRKQSDAVRHEDEAKQAIEDTRAHKPAKDLRGTTAAQAQTNAEWDELKIKGDQFKQCNDGRISIFGDPERRPPRPCQEELGFFDKPNNISFMCPYGIFENACGSDRETGFELGLLCASDPGACGTHTDNKHPGRGGAIGIAILTKVPAPIWSPCTFIYTTATYVEYYFPWAMLNTSRQMYQSGYLEEDVSNDLRRTGQTRLTSLARIETSSSVDLVARSANNTVKEMLGSQVGDALPQVNPQANQIAADAGRALDKIDQDYRDLSPHGSRQYTRNFSSVLDIRFQQPTYWYVPHYPLDTHRFGSEFPDLSTPIDIPMPTGEYQPSYSLDSAEGSKRGGLLFSRFLSMSARTALNGSRRLASQIEQLVSAGGATRCLSNNKATGKTPMDFLPQIAAGKDDGRTCIDDVGPRFPLTSVSFSGYNTDAYWRGLLSGGLDLFYALNWPTHYDADVGRRQMLSIVPPASAGFGGSLSYGNAPYHVYFDEYDRVALMPNPETSDPNFIAEVNQCGRIQDIADLNVNYLNANIHKPLSGAQNTAYVWGLVKGVWGYRGRIPMYTLEFGNTRYSQIKYRFR